MGLDMYLTKKTYVGNEYRKPENQIKVVMPESEGDATFKVKQPIKQERISYIEESIGYWRKANHIHKWFVDNIQGGKDDCGNYPVSEEKLQSLMDSCKEVLAIKDNAEVLLPTQSGFFFGGTDYDEYYFKDIEATIKIIADLFTERGEDKYLSGEVYYHSSW